MILEFVNETRHLKIVVGNLVPIDNNMASI